MQDEILVSVVVPVFNEIDVIDACYGRMTTVLKSLDGIDYELLFIDDGSTDRSYSRLLELQATDSHLKVIRFSRNFGHQIAITAGVDEAGEMPLLLLMQTCRIHLRLSRI